MIYAEQTEVRGPDGLIPDATVWVRQSNTPTGVVLASGRTNASGQVTFYLDPDLTTVYVWRHKTGYNFANPDVEVI